MQNYYFAVDLGATSGRTILGWFEDGKLQMEVVNRFPNQLIHVGKHYYWDIYELYRNITEGLKLVAERGVVPTSIGIDTWGVDVALVGKDGDLMRLPYSYRDPHTNGAPEKFFERMLRETLYGKTGIEVMNFNTLYQLDTMRRNGDSALEAADKILFMPCALAYMLTGEAVSEYTIASTSQMLDARKREFDNEILSMIGLSREKFGRFVMPGERIGVLTEEIQQMTGLPAVPVVAVAGHDTASAVAAVPTADSDCAYLSSGTWSLMGVETKEPVINETTTRLNVTNEGGVERTIRLLKNICGMWLLERCRKEWGNPDYHVLREDAAACEPFRSLIYPDDACFANPGNMQKAIVDFCERTHQAVPETQGQFVRCIFESLAMRYRQVLEALKDLANHPVNCLHIIGGGCQNAILNQFTANAIGMPVYAGPTEATSLGNMMIQAIAAGEASDVTSMRRMLHDTLDLETFMPDADRSAWDEAYARYLEICEGTEKLS